MATATIPAGSQAAVADKTSSRKRIASIDILRGSVMLIMAIDHVRDFYLYGHPDPTNLHTTTVSLFFTRWITHFCAPAFVFLSGISAYLAGTRRSRGELSGFLIRRGLWLIVAEILVVNLAITLNPGYSAQVLQVIWVIGASMVLLALVVRAPLAVTAFLGVLLVAGHNLLDIVHFGAAESVAGQLLLTGHGFSDAVAYSSGHVLIIAYALLPWAGLMMLGYVFGPLYERSSEPSLRRKRLFWSGIGALCIFVFLRYFNIYGDPAPWSPQPSRSLSVISFLNVTKYPPSLLYTCMTVGVALLVLSISEGLHNRFTKILTVYGSVPFFFYICHWYLIRLGSVGLFFISGHNQVQIINPRERFLFFQPNDMGFSLGGVYMVWMAVIVLLYFPCRWYSRYKEHHTDWWLSYL